jgi:hypothetical protein
MAASCPPERQTANRHVGRVGGLDGWRPLFWAAFNLSTNPMVLLQADRVRRLAVSWKSSSLTRPVSG